MFNRAKKLLKDLLFIIPIVFLLLVIFSGVFLLICKRDLKSLPVWLNALKTMFLFFGFPVLLMPLLEFIYPERDTDGYFYAGVGLYYGGAIISGITDIFIGFSVAFLLTHFYFTKVNTK